MAIDERQGIPARGATEGTSRSPAPPTAGEAASKAKEAAVSQLSSQKGRAAGMVGGLAESLRQASHGMEQTESPLPVQQYVDKAADQLDQLGSYIDGHEVREIVAEVENFARRQPALFLGAAFAAGLVAARFLRSSGGQPAGIPATRGTAMDDYGERRVTEPVSGA